MKEKLTGVGAVVAAVLASSCCILPALLALLGAGSLGVGAQLAALRPYFMGVTFALLAAAFYFTYRKKPQAAADDCCAVPASEDCCAVTQVDNLRYKANRTSKGTLWVVTAIALFAAFYPQIQAWRHSGGREVHAALLVNDAQTAQRLVFKIEGMSCEGCAANIEKSLMKVAGVTKAAVDFKSGKAVVKWSGKRPDRTALAKAVESVEGKAVFNNNAKEAEADAK